jgi:hypothetical protein
VFADPIEATRGIPFDQDDWPDWEETTSQTRRNVPPESSRPWQSPPGVITRLRSRLGGARNQNYKQSSQIPTETVSEGWLNKATGNLADSEPSDDSQIFIQTSRIQRYETRNNTHAVMRGTDDERSTIPSRVAGQKLKYFSGQERHYDMFPFQQDEIIRPFWYRHAATGPQEWMDPNEMYVSTAIQRTPPPDVGSGTPDIDLTLGTYGYTNEDSGWY